MRHSNIVACFLIANFHDQSLLALRQNTGYKDGWYSLVCGHVEAGETFTQAMIREAKEEADIELTHANLEVLHVMQRKSDTDGSERVDVYFGIKNWDGKFSNLEPHKCATLEFFDPDNLPPMLVPYVKFAFDQIAAKNTYSEFGW